MSKSSMMFRSAKCMMLWLFAAMTTAAAVSPAHAIIDAGMGTWVTTLQGRDLDGDFSNGFEAYYDTVLDITWLADASIVGQSFKFLDAQPFLDTHTIYGVGGWQLPYLQPMNESVDAADRSVQSSLAHLFWVTLGNTGFMGAYCSPRLPCGDITENIPAAPVNTGPFNSLTIGSSFWFNRADDSVSQSGYGWAFSFSGGRISGADMKGGAVGTKSEAKRLLWATHAGDVGVAAVPEPGVYGLALAGMFLLLASKRVRLA